MAKTRIWNIYQHNLKWNDDFEDFKRLAKKIAEPYLCVVENNNV